ncbi:hypothetical protein PEPS_04870 [Persicobacter psychrovividus]|uniref:Uncharacterized protein n=1 Tax=Persicobacter psychrovividus TaxID=387638 RepID=A0ABM7VBB7_9BACT|nr:hypothetical protein PEPS_04870 [Persicobacter psychrovividus]
MDNCDNYDKSHDLCFSYFYSAQSGEFFQKKSHSLNHIIISCVTSKAKYW